ncbi:hypothetical protein [Winogradskyella sp.]|uniref:hypothetical protein n=1 Tax=Winogradskyella sp. TaxID=1883156 RepID=UPI001B067AAC|nr:hypothetical protein [Winogradskyella sp.]MBO6881753.1 hypothetical protein [Winogradskyella sp.]
MIKIFLQFLILFLSVLNCQNNNEIKQFNIEIRDFDGSQGYSLTYKMNQDSLKILYNCDFENCVEKNIYNIELEKRQVSILYEYLKNSSLDSLKSKYIEEGYDGINLRLKVSGEEINSKIVRMERYIHPEVEKLLTEFNKLIPEKKYKLYD